MSAIRDRKLRGLLTFMRKRASSTQGGFSNKRQWKHESHALVPAPWTRTAKPQGSSLHTLAGLSAMTWI